MFEAIIEALNLPPETADWMKWGLGVSVLTWLTVQATGTMVSKKWKPLLALACGMGWMVGFQLQGVTPIPDPVTAAGIGFLCAGVASITHMGVRALIEKISGGGQ